MINALPHSFKILAAAALTTAPLQVFGVGAYWSFQDSPSGGSFTDIVSAEDFPDTPTFSRTGTATNFVGLTPDYTDFQGTSWVGEETSSWYTNSDSGPSTGISFSVSLNMTAREDAFARFDLLALAENGASSTFGDIVLDYSVDGGSFTSAGLDQAINGTTIEGGLEAYAYSFDLATLTAIENQSDVIFRWSLPDLDPGPGSQQYRLDNIEITAVPEPSTYAMIAGVLALGLAFWRRRK